MLSQCLKNSLNTIRPDYITGSLHQNKRNEEKEKKKNAQGIHTVHTTVQHTGGQEVGETQKGGEEQILNSTVNPLFIHSLVCSLTIPTVIVVRENVLANQRVTHRANNHLHLHTPTV